MNPQNVNGDEYNSFVAKYRLPEYQFVIDFVYDVEKIEVKEVTRDEFNILLLN